MPSFLNFRGYTATDPLDKASPSMRYVLAMIVTAVVSFSFFYIESVYDLKYVIYSSNWVIVVAVLLATFILAPLVVTLRKSSSLVFFLMVLIPTFLADLYFQAHIRDHGGIAPWMYLPNTFIYAIPIPLRFLAAWSFDSFILGPLALWITRLVAMLVYAKKKVAPVPTREQQQALYSDDWSKETVAKPHRDAAFWILRLLGFAYLSYLVLLTIGALGVTPWNGIPQIAQLLEMTYANPALAINTYGKISVMILLAFLGAYNREVRWHSTLGLFFGHSVSTAGSLIMYFANPGAAGRPDHDFLLTSAMVDGVFVLLFIWILIRFRAEAKAFAPVKEYPEFFSVPAHLSEWFYAAATIFHALLFLGIIALRIFSEGRTGLAAVYGYPDPLLSNTLTLYGTLTLLLFLLIKREKLRHYLFGVVLFPFVILAVVATPWFILGDIFFDVQIETRAGAFANVDWYFVLFIAVNVAIAGKMILLRKMYYNVDYVLTTVNPSSCRNIIGLVDALFGGEEETQAAIVQKIDKYEGGLSGRKRGLLNFPFWIVEHVFNVIYGLHPTFSTMSRDERRYFLRKYLMRPPAERARSFVPLVADAAFQIGMAVNAMVMVANYSHINNRKAIGYIPADARDRLQGDYPPFPPPFKEVAPLPKDPKDPANNRPDSPRPPLPLIAPRVSTPIEEPLIPSEVDYLIVGSGAGGATMAYRLAASGQVDPAQILVVERGHRYQPDQDFSDNEMDMLRKLYKEGGLQETKRYTMSVLQGECVGGTTVIYNAVCFKMTPQTRDEWRNEYGIDLDGLDREYQQVADDLEIHTLAEEGINRNVKNLFYAGVKKYNDGVSEHERLHGDDPNNPMNFSLNVNYRNVVGDGNWNLGNKRLRKRSMLETYLPWSEGRGVKIVSNVGAVRFHASDPRRADSVLLRSSIGDYKTVKVRKAVIVAGGVIASSHFLMRSGLKGNVGKHMACNFAFPVTFEFDEIINAFDGTQITLGALDPKNRAAFETYFNPPASFSLASVPFFFDRREAIMRRYAYMLNFGTLIGSEPNGVVQLKPNLADGRPFTWSLGERDRENIKYALTTLVKLGHYAGAKRCVMPSKPGIEFGMTDANVERFIKNFNAYPLRMDDLMMGTAHPQGGNRMVGDASAHKNTRVLNGNFQVEGYDNVYVADASLFPSSIGLNPQWTIMAMSSLATKKILAQHG